MERHRADLEREPTSVRKIAIVSSGLVPSVETNSEISESRVEPVKPKISDIPYSISADDEHADEVVLHAGFVGDAVVLAPGGEDERRDRDQLERHEDRDEVTGRDHDRQPSVDASSRK